MAEYPYIRPTYGGGYVSAKALSADIAAAIPGVLFVLRYDGDDALVNTNETLTQEQEDALDAAIAGHVPTSEKRFAPNHEVESLNGSGRIAKVEWFETDNGDGTYSGLSRDRVYAYQGSKLISKTEKTYYSDGTVLSTETTTYWTTPDGKRVTKRS